MPIHAQATGSRVYPRLASGRPRVESPVQRLGGSRPRGNSSRRGGPRRAGSLLGLMRRRPEELFQVYTEDEFLNGVGPDDRGGPMHASPEAWRTRRLAGVAMLVGALGTVVGVILVNVQWPAGQGSRAAGARPRYLAHRDPPVHASIAARARSASARVSSAAVQARATVTARARSAAASRRGPARRAALRSVAGRTDGRGDARGAAVARYVASQDAAVASVTAASHPPRAEFGFER